jgi:hypothetical protein
VILSSLKYRHEYAKDGSAWRLDDVLLLPFRNPLSRRSCFDDSIKEGLSIFHHYREEFELYNSILLAEWVPHGHIEAIKRMMKVSHFVGERLSPEERARFFPVAVP